MKYVLIVLCLIAAIAAAPFIISAVMGLLYLALWLGAVLFAMAIIWGIISVIWGAINGPSS